MSTRGRWVAILAVSALFAGNTAQALTVDEVIRLTQAGVGEPVIISQIQADATPVMLGANEIVALKQAHVTDTVILAMQQAARAYPAAAPAPQWSGSDDVAPRSSTRTSAIVVTNNSSRDVSLILDAEGRSIRFAEAGRGDTVVASGDSRIVRLPAGGYDVGWTGGATTYGAQVVSSRRSELVLRDRHVAGVSSIALDVLEGSEVVDGGTLKRFATRASDSESSAIASNGDGAETYTGTQVRRADGVQITINNSASSPSNSPSYAPPEPVVVQQQPQVVMYAQPQRRSMRFESPYQRRVVVAETQCWTPPPVACSEPVYAVPAYREQVYGGQAYGGQYYGRQTYGQRTASTDPIGSILGDNWQAGMPGARTLVGAGIGAVIGNQYDKKGQGAAIGAGVGYLLDQFLRR